MAGYNWYAGKSNNAVCAEGRGLMVATQFAAWAKRYVKGVTAADVRLVLVPEEWHHSSKMYNRVNYYNPTDLVELEARQSLRREVAARREYARLLKKASALGLTHHRTLEIARWYEIKTKWSGFDGRGSVDLERLRVLIETNGRTSEIKEQEMMVAC